MSLDEFFEGCPESYQIFEALRLVVEAAGPAEMRVTRSQIAFRRRRPFAWAWIPDRYLHGNHAPLVLSLAFGERKTSSRWKQVVEPAPGRFMHHMELYTEGEIDDEAKAWIHAAWEVAE